MDRHHRRRLPRLRDYDYERDKKKPWFLRGTGLFSGRGAFSSPCHTHPGACFATICAKERECAFEYVMDGSMQLNQVGQIVQEEWLGTAFVRREIDLDEFFVVPNPVHGMVVIRDDAVGATGRSPLQAHSMPRSGPAPRSLGSFVAGFRAGSTKRINQHRQHRDGPGVPVWQRNYHEHVVRDEEYLCRIQRYIANHPLAWETYEENRDCVRR
jgi:putative transposase